MTKSNFILLQQGVLNILKKATKSKHEADIEGIKTLFDDNKGNETEKKLAIEHALRELIMKTHINDMQAIEKLIEISIAIAKIELISPYSPVVLLVDVFDVKTLDHCENLFMFVEKNVHVFKGEHFFTPCKNHLLRMCNDLLRRLSRSQNTVFCGRILLFLAKFFPFSERSGLNIISEFNVENITEFGSVDGDDPMEETLEDSSLKVDRHLYMKFWGLQEFFRCPNNCYDFTQWKKFTSTSTDVLAAFKSFKLEESSGSKQMKTTKTTEEAMNIDNEKVEESSGHFFAKFLTNPKLLSLQLSDSNFRRTVLVQYLILFQYLTATVKFKSEKDQLNSTQQEWLQETELSVYKLLSETPPNGKEFVETIKHILKREEMWNNWKNESCKEIQRPVGSEPKAGSEPATTNKRKYLGDTIAEATKVGKFDLGNSELTRLWNLCPDNLQACKGSDRNFLPSLESYLDNPKEKNDPTYEWRALRLVSRQSSHFFTILSPPNEKIEKISDYLKSFHQKIQKDKGEMEAKLEANNNTELQIEQEQAEHFTEDAGDGIEDGEVADENIHKTTTATPEQIVEISKALGDDWKKLGVKLGYTSDVLEFYASKEKEPCVKMLSSWMEEDDDANLDNLLYTIEGLKLEKAVEVVKKMVGSEDDQQE
ncbi:CLUMA_CG005431, isoform A [Clunio marinus]|uniref:CLUMA_CG005431, isoform A n=1 Tax=Clunio marinus TaxID=568069 RepID=A0A1J1HZ40_9DIPT|nr:CLUMA_CG005431, isoform A [Clunio marinus]